MQSKSDAQLLRDYADRGVEAAFAEIVNRHTNLVYSAALRLVNSPDSAPEIAQNVFVGLARGAHTLSAQLTAEASLAGWLCRSTRNQALKFRRDDSRRHSRERQAMELLDPISETAPDWASLRPVLDEAMAELTDLDYDALVLRFFNNQDLKEVGRALGVSDDTAQKRVSRALDKLCENLTRRGVATTSAALSLAISANAVSVAPAGLAATISTAAALAGTALATTVTATAVKTIAMTTLQKTVITATLAAAIGTGIYEARQASVLRDQVQTLLQQRSPLADQTEQLTHERDEATRQMAALRDDNERLNRNTGDLLRLRAEVARLQKRPEAVALSTPAQEVLDTSDPNWKPNWIVLRPFDLSQFPDSTTNITSATAKDVGTATPAALLQTWMWAQLSGDTAGILKTWDFPEGTTEEQKLERVNETLRDEEYARQHPDSISHSEESSVRDLFSLKDGYYLAFIEQKQPTTGTYVSYQIFRRVGDEWKVSFGKSKQ